MILEFPSRPEDWTLEKLTEALAAGPSEWTTFEVKEKFSERVPETLCAFSNTHGGWLIVGVSKEGKFVGIKKAEPSHLDHLRQQISPAIGGDAPHFIPLADGRFVCVAWVPEGGLKPYQTTEGRHYVRSGSTNRVMTPGELADAFLRTEDLRQKGRLLLGELVHARDTHQRAGNQQSQGQSFLRFAKLDAALMGQLTVGIAPLLRDHPQLVRDLQAVRWAAEEYNAAMDRALFILAGHTDLLFRARLSAHQNWAHAEVSRLSGFFTELSGLLGALNQEGLIRQLAAVLGEPEPQLTPVEKLFP